MNAIVTGTSTSLVVVDAELAEIAARIRANIKMMGTAVLAIGADLLLAKGQLDHGNFINWLETEFGMSVRSAQRYMAAAKQFAGKSDTVSFFPVSTIHMLAASSTPEKIREQIVSRIEAGDKIDPRQVEEVIRQERSLVRHTRRREKAAVSPSTHRRHEQQRKKQEEEKARWVAEADAAALELLEKVGVETLRTIVQKLDDWRVLEAVRRLLANGGAS